MILELQGKKAARVNISQIYSCFKYFQPILLLSFDGDNEHDETNENAD
jgi:hypothetical protein